MNPNPRKVKNIIFFDPYHSANDPHWKTQEPDLFKKYFPKYLKYLPIYSQNGAVKSKVKRTKVIHDFKSQGYPEISPYWRVLLSNKMKSIKILSNTSQTTKDFIEKIKLFSGLQTIKLTPFDECEELEYSLCRKANRKMLELPKLKHLKIEIWALSEHYLYFFEDLNSRPTLLKSLKTHIVLFSDPEYEMEPRIETLKNYQNVMRYLTHFSIGKVGTPEQHQAFKNLADSCPNLLYLSFEFSCPTISHTRGGGEKHFSDLAHANCLSAIKKFQNLKSLDIIIRDNEAFFAHLALPTGIQSLSLEFGEDHSSEDLQESPFERNSNLVKFFENFERLENLEVLRFAFNEELHPDNYPNQKELFKCILRRLPALKKFLFAVENTRDWRLRWKCFQPIEESYLSQLLESCPCTLETLEIETYKKVLYSECDFSSLQNKFTNLKTIKFNGRFHVDNPKFLRSFLEQLISLGESIAKIEFTALFEDQEFCSRLFEELEKVSISSLLKLNAKIKPIKGSRGSQSCKRQLEELINKKISEQKTCQ